MISNTTEQSQILSNISEATSLSSEFIFECYEHYLCSINRTLMEDPVLGKCCDKRYYEKKVF